MKKIRSILTLSLVMLTMVSMAQVNWVSIEEAQELIKKEPKKILIDVYTKWCGPCKMMTKFTFNDKWTSDYINENYYAVKWDAEGPDSCTFDNKLFTNPGHVAGKSGRNSTHQFTEAIAPVKGRIAYPTIVFIDENLNLITPVQGYQKPDQFEPMLKFIKEEMYKTSNWNDYMKTFKSDRSVTKG